MGIYARRACTGVAYIGNIYVEILIPELLLIKVFVSIMLVPEVVKLGVLVQGMLIPRVLVLVVFMAQPTNLANLLYDI